MTRFLSLFAVFGGVIVCVVCVGARVCFVAVLDREAVGALGGVVSARRGMFFRVAGVPVVITRGVVRVGCVLVGRVPVGGALTVALVVHVRVAGVPVGVARGVLRTVRALLVGEAVGGSLCVVCVRVGLVPVVCVCR